MTTTSARRVDLVRQMSDRVGARERAAHYHLLAEQRRFALKVNAEVRASVEDIYQKRCAEAIKEAVAANQSSVIVYIPTSYNGEEEPIRPQFWWKAGVRCKAILVYLAAYLRKEGFSVTEGEQCCTREFRGAKPGD